MGPSVSSECLIRNELRTFSPGSLQSESRCPPQPHQHGGHGFWGFGACAKVQRAQEYKTGKTGEPTELQLKAALAAVLLKTAVASAEDSLSIAEYEGYTCYAA